MVSDALDYTRQATRFALTAQATPEYHTLLIFPPAMARDGEAGMNTAAWKQITLILALALTARLAAGVYLQTRLDRRQARFEFGDSQSYWTLGRAIAQRGPYRCGPENAQVFRTPGYPLLLAPIFCVAGDRPGVIWARAQSALFGTLAVGGVWWLGRELFDARTGLIAAAVATFYPGAVAISAFVLSEAPFCALMLLQFALWTAAWKARLPRRAAALAVLAGVAAGAATLVRPSWLLFTPFAVVVAFLVGSENAQADTGAPSPRPSPEGKGRRAWLGVVVLAALVVTMMPWWIRNARVTGRFVPTTLQVGASLYDGLNPQATGASNMDLVPKSVEQLRRQATAGEVPGGATLEIELDRRFRDAAGSFALNNPGSVARLAGVKLMRVWNVWPNEASFSAWPIRAAVVLSYLPVLVLGIIGAAGTIRRGWPYVICWLPVVYFTILHVIFVGSIRYRQPAMLGLIVLAAGVVGSWRRGAKAEG